MSIETAQLLPVVLGHQLRATSDLGGLALFARDGLLRLWGRWFRISPEQFDMLNICGITLYKTGIILFNLVPCIALYLVK